MKKLISVVCAAAMSCAVVTSLNACGKKDNTIHVYMPDGAPAIALSALMDSGYKGFDFTVVPSDEIAGTVSSRTADMAIMPIDAAAKLYNSGVDIVMLSVNTHGNLYMVGRDENVALEDLKGKRLGVIGQGSVPDNVLRVLLENEEIGYQTSETAVDGKVAITYNAATTLIPWFNQGKLDYILLGEPAVTNAMGKTSGKIAMDMQAQWQEAFEGLKYPQACLVAKGSVVKNKKGEVDKFLKAVSESDGWAESNPDKALKAVEKNMKKGNQTTLQALTADIIKRCNIKTVLMEYGKADCESYFKHLTGLKTALGTTVLTDQPDEGFYYNA